MMKKTILTIAFLMLWASLSAAAQQTTGAIAAGAAGPETQQSEFEGGFSLAITGRRTAAMMPLQEHGTISSHQRQER